jgi:hypothetical protein
MASTFPELLFKSLVYSRPLICSNDVLRAVFQPKDVRVDTGVEMFSLTVLSIEMDVLRDDLSSLVDIHSS